MSTQPPDDEAQRTERKTDPPGPGAYTDHAIDTLLKTARRLEEHYTALLNPDGILERHRFEISRLIDANYGLIHEHVKGLSQALAVMHGTVAQHGTQLETVDSEIAEIKARLGALERWRETQETHAS